MVVRLFQLSVALAWISASLAAQAPQAPKPGPEHEKLGYFVGKWTSEGEMKPSPFGPGGKMTMTETCNWFEGKFVVLCHSQGKGPMGAVKGVAIMSYSTEEKVYTYYGADSTGMTMASVPRGTVQGDTWTYTDESTMGGQKVKSRFTMTVQSPTAYTFKWEMQGADGKWTSLMEGRAAKTKTT
jgi:hypothetical protein